MNCPPRCAKPLKGPACANLTRGLAAEHCGDCKPAAEDGENGPPGAEYEVIGGRCMISDTGIVRADGQGESGRELWGATNWGGQYIA